jgi:hypothetical protein
MAGVIRKPGGGYVRSSGGRVVRVGPPAAVIQDRSMTPTVLNVLDTAVAGTVIASLVFTGYPESGANPFTFEFTSEFAGVSYTADLISNAGGRVALTGNWNDGYKIVIGGTPLTAGNYTLQVQVSGFPETHSISLRVEATAVVEAATLFTAKVENFDTITSWVDQEMSVGQWFKKGDVPNGSRAIITVDGIRIPQQVSNRTTWSDGSLKLAQVRFLMPAMAAGTTKTLTWQREAGTWIATDTALHTATTAITSKVTLQYEFTSYQGRNAAGTLTAQRGPKRFRSTDMLGTGNSTWVERIMAGPICTEWRASDLARNASGVVATGENLGCWLYARAWGGTANNPKRIQFLYRSIYAWNTDVAADEQGLRVDLNLSVNGTVVRGAAIGTANWGAVNTWKGGFVASCGTEGTMDWFDVATNSFVTPPKLIYRHNIPYGISTNFVPPFDTSNPSFPMTPGVQIYRPGRRGPLRPDQSDVAEHEMICWTTAKPMARCVAAHARATAQQLSDHQRYARSAGWGMGAMTGVGLHRDTRKILCYLPPEKSTNQTTLGSSIYGQGKVVNADAALRWPNGGTDAEIKNLDAAHFPQMSHWPYISEGDQHWLDLAYHEATLPGLFESPAYGFYGTTSRAKITFGGISVFGQIRATGHTARPIGNAVGIGNPNDPHWVMCRDYLEHWCEMAEEVPLEEDAWRGGVNLTDGRRFQDLKLLVPNNEPCYKIWMHVFGLCSTSYAYGISENLSLKSRAEWWAHAPTVMAGGYHNDAGAEYYLMKPDPTEAVLYQNVSMNGVASPNSARRFWFFGQWRGGLNAVTYKADGQTCVFTDAAGGMSNGMVVTVSAPRQGDELEVDNSKPANIPTGLTAGTPYYTIQANFQSTKLSLSPTSNTPVTFSTGGVDMVGQCIRCPVGGVHGMRAPSTVQTGGDAYIVLVMSALAVYQHYVDPTNARVLLARQKLFDLKDNSTAPNAYDERGKMTVPLTQPQVLSYFSSEFSNEFA